MEELLRYKLRTIHRLLSKPKVIDFLQELSRSNENASVIASRLGIKRRTYYYILRELKKEGLIIGEDGRYRLTFTGYFVLNAVERTKDWMSNLDEIIRLDELIKNSENVKLNAFLLRSLESMVGLSNIQPVRIFPDRTSFKKYLSESIKSAKAYVGASLSFDDLDLLHQIVDASKNGVVVRAVVDESVIGALEKDVNRLGEMSLLEEISILRSVGALKTGRVPRTFALIDFEDVLFEIRSPREEKEFIMGIYMKSPTVAEKVGKIFDGHSSA
ncbi:MAG: hypothetical protein ACP5LW_02470 [Nitrososphaeria archaeon]